MRRRMPGWTERIGNLGVVVVMLIVSGLGMFDIRNTKDSVGITCFMAGLLLNQFVDTSGLDDEI